MWVEFNALADESKIWIYQASRSFTDVELQELEMSLKNFVDNWAAHGTGLKASFLIKYKRFIILGVDAASAQASGCSIDTSVRFIQELETKYAVDLLDKMNVTFKQGEYLAYKPLIDFKKLVKNKSVSGKTIVFNNLVNIKKELETDWEIPLEESWHNRFL
ncbi:ABC transporter ATPase [Mesonia sp. HuA40]|uniref:ABC transporter ATPase n=1 Tax=Mesonia sp. HuA40 TaxID=2602761 RepID=UPI0011CA7974|nr:ABC transporter ATPase [Mesonia sp. HuA40]TXK71002.1 ABC transporter ATPase [Mesonia sp. HuA40]